MVFKFNRVAIVCAFLILRGALLFGIESYFKYSPNFQVGKFNGSNFFMNIKPLDLEYKKNEKWMFNYSLFAGINIYKNDQSFYSVASGFTSATIKVTYTPEDRLGYFIEYNYANFNNQIIYERPLNPNSVNYSWFRDYISVGIQYNFIKELNN